MSGAIALIAMVAALLGAFISGVMLVDIRLKLRGENQSIGVILVDTALLLMFWAVYVLMLLLARTYGYTFGPWEWWRVSLYVALAGVIWGLIVRMVWWRHWSDD